MYDNEVEKTFNIIIEKLKLAIFTIKEKTKDIESELNHWKAEINIDELKESLPKILEKITKWQKQYNDTKNILKISLKEYDWVSKEVSYILGECALIDDLYMEVIDYYIGSIGALMCDKIREGGKTNE